jgi:hypothetical protein
MKFFGGVVKSLIIATLCLFLSFSATAQDSSGAEAAFRSYWAVTKTYDTEAMAASMHPDALRRFRTSIDAALAGPKRDRAANELLPLFSVTTVAAYSALSDSEAYKRLNDTLAKGAPDLLHMMSTSDSEIVGTLVKDGIAYVTYNLKMTVQGNSISTQAVQTLKMHNGKWLLMLPPTADATIAGIDAEFK